MKLGLKIRTNHLERLDEYKEVFDFFEIFVEPEAELQQLENLNKEITIHAAHHEFGFNSGDSKKYELNKKILDQAIQAAEIVKAQWIIVHPGYIVDDDYEKTMISFFQENFDKRLLLENCPYLDYSENNERYLFSTPGEVKRLLDKIGLGLCLDFGHAVCAANVLKEDSRKMIKEFFDLKPEYFHLTGIAMDAVTNDHEYHLDEVENDFEFLKRIGKSQPLVLEVPLNDRAKILKDAETARLIAG